MKIGELLVADKIITEEQLQKALEMQNNTYTGKKIGEILILCGYLKIDVLIKYIDKQLNDL